MNASPENQRLLLEIADMDRRISQTELARTRPPQGPRISELSAARQEQLRELTALAGVRDDLRTELKRVESDVTLVAQRSSRDSARLAASTNAKDAQALEHEIESLARRRSDLEDIQLDLMSRLEAAEAAVEAQQAVIAKTTAEGTELTAQAKSVVSRATEEAAQLARDRAAVSADIATDLLAEYDRRAAKGTGAALLRRGTCEGCRMMLSGTDLNKVRQAARDAVVSCPECNCILVRTEESGV